MHFIILKDLVIQSVGYSYWAKAQQKRPTLSRRLHRRVLFHSDASSPTPSDEWDRTLRTKLSQASKQMYTSIITAAFLIHFFTFRSFISKHDFRKNLVTIGFYLPNRCNAVSAIDLLSARDLL